MDSVDSVRTDKGRGTRGGGRERGPLSVHVVIVSLGWKRNGKTRKREQ